MLIPISFIIAGVVLLFFGADAFVKGAASLARRFNISPLVIGLTVVALGTSAPELAVNLFSALQGTTDLAIGNVIGSNISNILLILGLSALISPLIIRDSTARLEMPYLIATAVLFFGMAATGGTVTLLEGVVLIFAFVLFLIYTLLLARNHPTGDDEIRLYPTLRSLVMGTGGLIVLLVGAKILVDNAMIVARFAGMSEALIGLTVVAIGTSLPELATSVVAAYRKHNDIAVGNIIGSNIFNILWILGVTSVIRPLPVSSIIQFDIIVNIAISIILFLALFVFQKNRLGKIEGTVFLGLYLIYMTYIISRG